MPGPRERVNVPDRRLPPEPSGPLPLASRGVPRRIRVVQVSVFLDPRKRGVDLLLDDWTGLTVPAAAAVAAGCEVAVVQAAHEDENRVLDAVAYHFVAERPASAARRRLGRWAAPLTQRVLDRVVSLDPDVVHFHGLSFPRHASRLVEAVGGLPVLAQDHADRPAPVWRRRIDRRAFAGLAGVLFTAREQAGPLRDLGLLPPDVPVFEVFESTTRFTPGDVREARRLTGLGGDPCLLWVGRLDRNKDPLTVLEAFSRTADVLPDARLWMCYRDAPLLAAVESRVRSSRALQGRVCLMGERPREEVERLLRASDFLVLGSHREGSGYAVIEALACGTVPLVTDIPSLRRVTGGGKAGALSPPGDASAMTRAMVAWARLDRTALRRAAREHFERSLSLAALGSELRMAYEAAASSRRVATDA